MFKRLTGALMALLLVGTAVAAVADDPSAVVRDTAERVLQELRTTRDR
jgi:ABC-type transporter MlaC component